MDAARRISMVVQVPPRADAGRGTLLRDLVAIDGVRSAAVGALTATVDPAEVDEWTLSRALRGCDLLVGETTMTERPHRGGSRRLPGDAGLTARMGVTMLLLAAVYALLVTVLWAAGGSFVLIGVVVAGLAVAQYYYSDRLLLAAIGARVVSRAEAPDIVDRVSRLAAQFDLPVPRVAIIDSDVPNALATGRDPAHSVVAVTTGILRRLDGPELDAVLAHELSHVLHRDAAVLTMAAVFATVASFIVQMGFWLGLGRGDDRDGEGRPSVVVVYLVSLGVWLVSFVLIRALSRYRELAADRGSAAVTGAPSELASALVKISGSLGRIPDADLRTVEPGAALLIVPAFSRQSLAGLLSTHPSLETRLEQLRRLEAAELAR